MRAQYLPWDDASSMIEQTSRMTSARSASASRGRHSWKWEVKSYKIRDDFTEAALRRRLGSETKTRNTSTRSKHHNRVIYGKCEKYGATLKQDDGRLEKTKLADKGNSPTASPV